MKKILTCCAVALLAGTSIVVARWNILQRPGRAVYPKGVRAAAADQNMQASMPQNGDKTTEASINSGLQMIAEVISLIDKKAIRHMDFQKFIEEGLKAAVPIADGHSAFFTTKSYKEMIESTSGKFSGIGVSIISKQLEDEGIVIVDVIENGPAHKAEVLPGDEIVEVDGDKLKGLSTDEVVSKLRGQVGTKVKIKLIRNKKIEEFTLTRDMIKNEVLTTFFFPEHRIFYVSLKLFTENAAKSVEQLLQRALKDKPRGILLDLRRNPGGILDTAIDIAGLFLDQGSLVVSAKDREGTVVSEYKTTGRPIFKSSIPIFCLVDNFTASASEILAGTLRHYSDQSKAKGEEQLTAFVIGTQTFGKGSVQEVIPISNGAALKLTTMLYYLPNGTSIQAAGVEPDFLIKPRSPETKDMKFLKELYGTETSIKHHITREEVAKIDGKPLPPKQAEKKEESEEEDKKKSWLESRIAAMSEDPTIQAAVNMINLLAFAKTCKPELVASRKQAVEFLKKEYVTDSGMAVEKLDL